MSPLADNPFNTVHAPTLWAVLLTEFGQEVNYWPDRDDTQALVVSVIWKEGAEDEEVSPGRYSNIWVQNSDFSALPHKGDAVESDGKVFDVVRIDATRYGYSRLVLQEDTYA